jgi:hypothetical protein
MLQRWSDHEGKENRVIDCYNRNVLLCDLRAQPEEVKNQIRETIQLASVPRSKPQIGMHFMKFCGRHNLVKISEQAQQYAEIFSAGYPVNSQ